MEVKGNDGADPGSPLKREWLEKKKYERICLIVACALALAGFALALVNLKLKYDIISTIAESILAAACLSVAVSSFRTSRFGSVIWIICAGIALSKVFGII